MASKDDKAEPSPPPEIGHAPGRVEFDARGNSVWRWAKDVIDSTSILLKRLDNKDLQLEPTRKVPIMRAKPEAATAARNPGAPAQKISLADLKKKGGGFDPYNSR